MTPVCTSEITTGEGPAGHWISGMNWYLRAERRYVEYGSSFEATRAFGLFRSLYDTVYNMNMAHLSDEVETVFETLGDHGVRTACTPFLIYRGRTRHEMGLEGLLRRVAIAATFRHATWGPDELFYGELYSSRRVPCKPTLARPGTRDEYSACCGRELVENDLYDFLLFSLPDNDYHSHKFGPEAQAESVVRADAAFAELVDASGGLDPFLESNAVILVADHAQTEVTEPLPLAEELATSWRVLQPNDTDPELAELAVCPSSRAGAVYVLGSGRRAERTHAGVRERLRGIEGVDLFAWLEDSGAPVQRAGADGPPAQGTVAVVERAGSVLRFSPGREVVDRRGAGWSLDGDPETLAATVTGNVRLDRLSGRARAPLVGAHRAPRRRDPALRLARLRARRLGRGHALSGRQPWIAGGRRLARSARRLRARARDRGEPRAVVDRRCRRARPRPLRARAADRFAAPDSGRRRGGLRGRRPIEPFPPPACCGVSTTAPAGPPTGCSCFASGSSGPPVTRSTSPSSRCSAARSTSITSPPRSAPSASR